MLTTLFSLPAHLLVEDVLIENQVLTLVITSTLAEMPCPDCRQPARRIHSRYTRTLADLPCQGRAVRLLVRVRRFFCDAPTCSRKTFAEAFTGIAPKNARRTSRQAESLCSIAYALGGRAGAHLVQVYSGLVFRGLGLVASIKADLLAALAKSRSHSLADLVGADVAAVTAEPWPN